MHDIEALLPHRAPFLFVDEITSFTDKEIVGIKTFHDSELIQKSGMYNVNYVPGMILVESMAQCGGAGVRLLANSTGSLFALASIDKAEFPSGAGYNVPVKYVIQNIRVSEKIIKQSGTAYVDGTVVAEATWVCVRFQQ